MSAKSLNTPFSPIKNLPTLVSLNGLFIYSNLKLYYKKINV
jgi:hypothetical protein